MTPMTFQGHGIKSQERRQLWKLVNSIGPEPLKMFEPKLTHMLTMVRRRSDEVFKVVGSNVKVTERWPQKSCQLDSSWSAECWSDLNENLQTSQNRATNWLVFEHLGAEVKVTEHFSKCTFSVRAYQSMFHCWRLFHCWRPSGFDSSIKWFSSFYWNQMLALYMCASMTGKIMTLV